MTIVGSGSLCLGAVIGLMARPTFTKIEKLDAKALASIVSVMVGAAVIGIFQAFSGKELPDQVYYYPVGLLVGYAFAWLIEALQSIK